MANDIYNRYKLALPPQGRTALEGVGKLISSLTGCSNNALPTSAEDSNVIHPAGSKVCYQLGPASYTVILLEDMLSDRMSTLAQFDNGKQTMIENSWVSDMSPTCGRDKLP